MFLIALVMNYSKMDTLHFEGPFMFTHKRLHGDSKLTCRALLVMCYESVEPIRLRLNQLDDS